MLTHDNETKRAQPIDVMCISKASCVASAGLGCIVYLGDLGEKYIWPSQSVMVDQSGEEKSIAGQNGIDASQGKTTNDSLPSAATELESRLSQRVKEVLANRNCRDVTLKSVSAQASLTPAAESTSGFDGVHLEGTAVLSVNGATERVRLLGTGKGPTAPKAEIRASDMAIEQFSKLLSENETTQKLCNGG